MKAILRRVATVAMVAVFVGVSALPAQAAAWVWQSPGQSNSTFHCGNSRTVDTRHGGVTFQECVISYRSSGGTRYLGLLFAYFTSTSTPTRAESFSGGQSVRLGGSEVDNGSCGSATFSHHQQKWCFTPTRRTQPGPLITATGYVSYRRSEVQRDRTRFLLNRSWRDFRQS